MKQNYSKLSAFVLIVAAGWLFSDAFELMAQRKTTPQVAAKKIIPIVIELAKGTKQGMVTFNHVRHNGGEYNAGGPILCTECHHTAQPKSELVKFPPLKTVWPAERTTTLTADLYNENPTEAGVASCRECHSRAGTKPKLLRKIPEYDDPGSEKVTILTNQIAFHQACDVCHFQIGFRTSGTKAPTATNCRSCHKAPRN